MKVRFTRVFISIVVATLSFSISPFAQGDPLDSEPCRLKKVLSNWPLAPGFPRDSSLIPSVGKIRHLFIYVDFPDNKSTQATKSFANQYFAEAKKFIEAQSYGRLKIDSDITPKVFRINKNSASYGMSQDGQGYGAQLIQDAIDAADPSTDFSRYDFVTVIPPKNTTTIKFGGTHMGGSEQYKSDEKSFSSGITIGKNKLSNFSARGFGWSMFSHEIGHVLGLTHPYYQRDGGPAAIWDLMGNGGTSVPEFIGWHRFELGWLNESEILCLSNIDLKTQTLTLAPINSKASGKKFAMVGIDSTKALGIEVRRASKYDKLATYEEGTIVYLIDVTKGDDEGIISILGKKATTREGQTLESLQTAEKITYQGITIKVAASGKSGDRIEISSSQ